MRRIWREIREWWTGPGDHRHARPSLITLYWHLVKAALVHWCYRCFRSSFCSRCDRAVMPRHFRRCPCLVIDFGEDTPQELREIMQAAYDDPEPITGEIVAWPAVEAEPEWTGEALRRGLNPRLYADDDTYWGERTRDLYAWLAFQTAEQNSLRRACGLPDRPLPALPRQLAAA